MLYNNPFKKKSRDFFRLIPKGEVREEVKTTRYSEIKQLKSDNKQQSLERGKNNQDKFLQKLA